MLLTSAASERFLATKRFDAEKETAQVLLLVVAASSVAGGTPTLGLVFKFLALVMC